MPWSSTTGEDSSSTQCGCDRSTTLCWSDTRRDQHESGYSLQTWRNPVTDELIDRLVTEAEQGYAVETLRRRGGRPPLESAAAEVVPVRLDSELRAALNARAEACQTTASDVIRQALRAWLDAA